jgi:predicted metal-dependent hydrolase
MTDLAERHVAVKDGHPRRRRMVRFDWSGTPLHWVPDDPFSTHMINVLHLLLPAGERWFIQVVNEAAPLITDDELAAAEKPFIQQETWHAQAHALVLQHLAEGTARYLRPSHHPVTEADTEMALEYLEKSPAARAAREAREKAAVTGG